MAGQNVNNRGHLFTPEPGNAVPEPVSRTPDAATVLVIAGIAAALIIHIVISSYTLRRPFDAEPHTWASSLSCLIARAYAENGIWPLRGIQIPNNPPQGIQPDAYIHWPPLFTMLLSRVFLVFGESEGIARAFTLLISAVWVIVTYFLVKITCGRRIALAAILGFLSLPAFFSFTRLVERTALAILFEELTLLAFIRATQDGKLQRQWARAGGIALGLGVLSSWEPLLLLPTLIVIAFCQRDRLRLHLAGAYFAVGVATFLSIIVWYAAAAPYMVGDLWQSVLYRTGATSLSGSSVTTLHAIPNKLYYTHKISFFGVLNTYKLQVRDLLGWLPVLAFAFSIINSGANKPNQDLRTIWLLLGGLLGPWVLWYMLMPNQVADNEYQMLLAVPIMAVCIGIGLIAVHDALQPRLNGKLFVFRWAVVCAIIAYLVWPLLSYERYWSKPPEPTGKVEYAHDIMESTPPSAIVLTRSASLVPTYYAHRHVIRATKNDAAVKLILQHVDAAFPGSPVYLAIEPDKLEAFRQTSRLFRVSRQTSHLVLFEIGTAGADSMARAAERIHVN